MKLIHPLAAITLSVSLAACSDNRDTHAEREAQMGQDMVLEQPQNTTPPQIPTQPQTPESQEGTLSNGRGGSPNPTPPT